METQNLSQTPQSKRRIKFVVLGIVVLAIILLFRVFNNGTSEKQTELTLEEQYTQAKAEHAKAELRVLQEKKDVEREQLDVDEANKSEETSKKKVQELRAQIQGTPIGTGTTTGEVIHPAPAVLVESF